MLKKKEMKTNFRVKKINFFRSKKKNKCTHIKKQANLSIFSRFKSFKSIGIKGKERF